LVDAVVQLEECFADDGLLPVRAGIAWGQVILFEGDDYTGSAVNLASRLCDIAAPFEVLATAAVGELAPPDVDVVPAGSHDVPGFGVPIDVVRLTRTPEPDPAAEALASAE
jgi:class 3 adenylate cyclase